MTRRPCAARAAGLVAACALLFAATPAFGTTGVAVDLGRIDITQPLVPGGAYTLPALGVLNPGTERTSYVMVANPVQDPDRAAPTASWFVFEPASVTLEPGGTERIRIRLVLPADAQPGDYIALVGAQITTEGGGARVGAAAAARTTFTIAPASDLQALGVWIGRTLTDLMPWSVVVPAAVLLAVAAWFLRRRFTLRIGIERRTGRGR